MATLSSLIGLLVFLFVVDPRKTVGANRDVGYKSDRDEMIVKGTACASSVWFESWTATKAVIKVPTFQIIVLQGIVGSLPWTAMFYSSTFKSFCNAMGSFLGRLIADRMSKFYPHSGRIMCAQFSAFMGIAFSWFLLKMIPQSVSSYHTFSVTLLLMGLTINWNATAANGPMFAEVCPH
ncbi:hypothetical protein V6N13_126973 [Hibiscus sabdariffa]|uniref:Uncharacterized protein n=1 Tax=Hibiscus sabdariffa TaxID=183260 RepID=A0ABR2RE22_9ROSI